MLEYSHWTLSSELDIGSCSLMGLYSGVVGTRYGLEGPGIESLWGENFRTHTDRFLSVPSLLYQEYSVIPRGRDKAAEACF